MRRSLYIVVVGLWGDTTSTLCMVLFMACESLVPINISVFKGTNQHTLLMHKKKDILGWDMKN